MSFISTLAFLLVVHMILMEIELFSIKKTLKHLIKAIEEKENSNA